MMLSAMYFSFHPTMVQNNVVVHTLGTVSPVWFFRVCGILFCVTGLSGNSRTGMKEVVFLKKLLSCSFQTVLETNTYFLFRKMSSENSCKLLPMAVITLTTVAVPAMTTSVVWNKLVEQRETQGGQQGGSWKLHMSNCKVLWFVYA